MIYHSMIFDKIIYSFGSVIRLLSRSFFCLLLVSIETRILKPRKTKEAFIMYYSAGTYEAFAHPEKPKDVDNKSAYIIGTGLAGLTAAF